MNQLLERLDRVNLALTVQPRFAQLRESWGSMVELDEWFSKPKEDAMSTLRWDAAQMADKAKRLDGIARGGIATSAEFNRFVSGMDEFVKGVRAVVNRANRLAWSYGRNQLEAFRSYQSIGDVQFPFTLSVDVLGGPGVWGLHLDRGSLSKITTGLLALLDEIAATEKKP